MCRDRLYRETKKNTMRVRWLICVEKSSVFWSLHTKSQQCSALIFSMLSAYAISRLNLYTGTPLSDMCQLGCIWWCHQMETFSALLAICEGNTTVTSGSPHKGQWRGALMFSLICAWTNGWANHRDAGDLRRHRAHYNVAVMRRPGTESEPSATIMLTQGDHSLR